MCGEVIVNSLHFHRCLLEDKLVQLSYFAAGILSNILLAWTDEDLLPMSLKLLMLVKLVRTPEGGGALTKFYTGSLRLEVSGGFSGESRGGAPLFSDQTEARRAEKNCFGDRAPPLFQGLGDSHPLHLNFGQKRFPFRLPSIDK